MRLQDKVAVITGAGSGMGAAEAKLFTREGAKVVIADVWDEGGEQVAGEIQAAGGEARFVHADVSREADWESVIGAATDGFGRLDVLVNNAGLSSTSVEDPLSPQGWDSIMSVNATGTFLGIRHAIAAMLETGGGSVVNISSIMGFVGGAGGHPAYHASKGAVRLLTKAIAVRYGPQGIRCNSVHPGFMPPMRSSRSTQEALDRAARITPLRRIGEPIEVANAVLFLASDEASFITGTELVVDGGFIAQ